RRYQLDIGCADARQDPNDFLAIICSHKDPLPTPDSRRRINDNHVPVPIEGEHRLPFDDESESLFTASSRQSMAEVNSWKCSPLKMNRLRSVCLGESCDSPMTQPVVCGVASLQQRDELTP